jgi:hypothetical protein
VALAASKTAFPPEKDLTAIIAQLAREASIESIADGRFVVDDTEGFKV